MTQELISQVVFFFLAAIAVGSALGMLFSRNAIHSALFLVVNFAVVSLFFLILAAPFIAMVQVTVYAGAIMVLFLFVIMLLGAELLRQPSAVLPRQRGAALLLAIVFVGVVAVYVFLAWGRGAPPPDFGSTAAAREFGGPLEIGTALYTRYLLPFELTSLLLLVAMVGAVVLTRDEKKTLNR
jgi:NADH-quinone oxidoreductase subunit J